MCPLLWHNPTAILFRRRLISRFYIASFLLRMESHHHGKREVGTILLNQQASHKQTPSLGIFHVIKNLVDQQLKRFMSAICSFPYSMNMHHKLTTTTVVVVDCGKRKLCIHSPPTSRTKSSPGMPILILQPGFWSALSQLESGRSVFHLVRIIRRIRRLFRYVCSL